jgi:two-component sensor histidine kinase
VPLRVVERLRPIRNRPLLGLIAGFAIFVIAFLLRYAAGGVLESVPFITLFPAILLSALVGGLRVGLAIAVVSFFAGWYFFLPPYRSWSLQEHNAVWALILFWVTAGIQLYVIDALNRAVDGLSAERDRVGVLFRELQHRVANNMMFVASLIRLQRKAIEARPESAFALLDQAQARLETMARIHRRLYDPEVLDRSLTTYFEALVRDILEAAGAKNIAYTVEVAPAQFDLSRLVILSLLMNELVTNAIKHGLAGREHGTVAVKLDRQGDQFLLTVGDDGLGMPASAVEESSLGMAIIRSLAAQLGGEVTWSSGPGTTATVLFPD